LFIEKKLKDYLQQSTTKLDENATFSGDVPMFEKDSLMRLTHQIMKQEPNWSSVKSDTFGFIQNLMKNEQNAVNYISLYWQGTSPIILEILERKRENSTQLLEHVFKTACGIVYNLSYFDVPRSALRQTTLVEAFSPLIVKNDLLVTLAVANLVGNDEEKSVLLRSNPAILSKVVLCVQSALDEKTFENASWELDTLAFHFHSFACPT
jgi:hypothetical protein